MGSLYLMGREVQISEEAWANLQSNLNELPNSHRMFGAIDAQSSSFDGERVYWVSVPEGLSTRQFEAHLVNDFNPQEALALRQGHLSNVASDFTNNTGLSPVGAAVDMADNNLWRASSRVNRNGSSIEFRDRASGAEGRIRFGVSEFDPTQVTISFELQRHEQGTANLTKDMNKILQQFGAEFTISDKGGRVQLSGHKTLGGQEALNKLSDRVNADRDTAYDTARTTSSVDKEFGGVISGATAGRVTSGETILKGLPVVDTESALMSLKQRSDMAEFMAGKPDEFMQLLYEGPVRRSAVANFENDLVAARVDTLVRSERINGEVADTLSNSSPDAVYLDAVNEARNYAALNDPEFKAAMQEMMSQPVTLSTSENVPETELPEHVQKGLAAFDQSLEGRSEYDGLEGILKASDDRSALKNKLMGMSEQDVAMEAMMSQPVTPRSDREVPEVDGVLDHRNMDEGDYPAVVQGALAEFDRTYSAESTGNEFTDLMRRSDARRAVVAEGFDRVNGNVTASNAAINSDSPAQAPVEAALNTPDAAVEHDRHSGGGFKGGAKSAAVQGIAAVAGVAILMMSTPSTASALPMPAQDLTIDQDYISAGAAIVESGEYPGIMLRAGVLAEQMGQPSEYGQQIFGQFMAAKANGDLTQASAYLAEGLGVEQDVIDGALNHDASIVAGYVAESVMGEDGLAHAENAASYVQAAFAISASDVGGYLDRVSHSISESDTPAYQAVVELSNAINTGVSGVQDFQLSVYGAAYHGASNIIGFNAVDAWQSGDTVLESVDAVIHEGWNATGGAVIDLAGMAMGAIAVGLGIEKAQPTEYQVRFEGIEDQVALLADKGLADDAPPELEAMVINYAHVMALEEKLATTFDGMARMEVEMALDNSYEAYEAHYSELTNGEGMQIVAEYLEGQGQDIIEPPQSNAVEPMMMSDNNIGLSKPPGLG